jgi:hypothetical protein
MARKTGFLLSQPVFSVAQRVFPAKTGIPGELAGFFSRKRRFSSKKPADSIENLVFC